MSNALASWSKLLVAKATRATIDVSSGFIDVAPQLLSLLLGHATLASLIVANRLPRRIVAGAPREYESVETVSAAATLATAFSLRTSAQAQAGQEDGQNPTEQESPPGRLLRTENRIHRLLVPSVSSANRPDHTSPATGLLRFLSLVVRLAGLADE